MLGDPFLIVRLRGKEFLIPASVVLSVMSLRKQRLLPSTPRGLFRRRLKVHGTFIPVGAPHEALGLPEPGVSARTCVLVVERPQPGGEPIRFGVIVDSVSRIERFPAKHVRPASVRISGKWRPVLDLDLLFPASAVRQAALSGNAA